MQYNKTPLNEVTRWDIIRRSQKESPTRFQKRNFYRVKDFDNVNFNYLFTDDTFVWSSRVGDYIVTLSFEGAFELLKFQTQSWKGVNRWKRITLQLLTNTLSKALDEEDLYVNCTCDDFKYRFAYWATKADCKYGSPQNTAPKVRNINNNNGYVCKHTLTVLYGKRWVPAAAKAWLSYIKANPKVVEYYIWGDPRKRTQNNIKNTSSRQDDDLVSKELTPEEVLEFDV